MSLTFKEPKNANYVAVVTRIRSITTLPNCDNVVGTPLFGYQAIVSKNTNVGDLVVVFMAETQLSEAYAAANNLFRDTTMNADQTKKGYLEANRRVRAIKFRGQRSDALVMPIESLAFTGIDVSKFKEGDQFDELAGIEICRKYVVERKQRTQKVAQAPDIKRIDKKFLPEHTSTSHWFRVTNNIHDDAEVVVTQKLHGTSIRIGHVPVNVEPTWKEKVAKFFGVKVQTREYAHVYGSRRAIKDANNPSQAHFYKDDIWSSCGKKYDTIVPANFILYGELIGWTPSGSAIQPGYTYNVPEGRADLYVYRIMVITNDGRHVELSWDAVKRFCVENGIMHAPEFFRGKKADLVASGRIEALMDIRYYDEVMASKLAFTDMPVPLSDPDSVDEGVCIRVLTNDASEPYITKAKSPKFIAYETIMMDNEVVDLESSDV